LLALHYVGEWFAAFEQCGHWILAHHLETKDNQNHLSVEIIPYSSIIFSMTSCPRAIAVTKI
jgi:hypothetical protein